MFDLDYKKIGKFICEEREKLCLTQEQLAQKVFVTRQAVSKWERGLALPDYNVLLSLCDLFQITSNEFLVGERKNSENKKYINNVPIDILKSSKKKYKKMIFIFGIWTFILVISFLIYYFISTYNKMEIYLINGGNQDFKINDSLVVFSNEVFYMKLGSVISDEHEYEYINMYFMNDDKKKNLFTTSHKEPLIIQNNGYNELFDFKDKKVMLDNLYIDVHYKTGKEELIDTIKLDVEKMYNNDSFLFKKSIVISDDDSEVSDIGDMKIPERILKEFELNEEGNYFLSYKKKNKKVELTYEPVVNVFFVRESSLKNTEEYIYLAERKTLSYTREDLGKIYNSTFINSEIVCSNDECEKYRDKYNYFLDEYYSYLK